MFLLLMRRKAIENFLLLQRKKEEKNISMSESYWLKKFFQAAHINIMFTDFTWQQINCRNYTSLRLPQNFHLLKLIQMLLYEKNYNQNKWRDGSKSKEIISFIKILNVLISRNESASICINVCDACMDVSMCEEFIIFGNGMAQQTV